jgi:hypothetical protein
MPAKPNGKSVRKGGEHDNGYELIDRSELSVRWVIAAVLIVISTLSSESTTVSTSFEKAEREKAERQSDGTHYPTLKAA